MTQKTAHTLPAWTEVNYTALCKIPYISTPFFIPKETQVYLCREDGSKEEARMIFLVFKSTDAPEDAEWEDDPIPGEMWVNVLGDDDEEIEPVKVVYLGMDLEDFLQVEHEDDQYITFNIYWRYGEVKIEKAEITDEGFVCKKEDFGDEGLLLTFIPKKGKPFSTRLQIPYIGFSLYDKDGNKLHGDVEVAHDMIDSYTYDFVGNDSNDRFSLNLDNDKLVYLCVLRPNEGHLVVRDMREKLAVVDQIPVEGKLSELLMGAHHALVKNKNYRWRISLEGSSVVEEELDKIDAETLVHFAKEQFDKTDDKDALGGHLVSLEMKYSFQWCWLKEDDWSHDDAAFDMFMKMLVAYSYVSQKPIQGDQLQARNNKRKIRRCAKLMVAHQLGEENLWEADEETRRELLHLFATFHSQFVDAVEEEKRLL